jgi:putative transposase
MGVKRHVLVEGSGVPIGLVVTGANRHDITQVERVLSSLPIERPDVTPKAPQNLCADKGYDGQDARKAMVARGYTPQVISRGEEKKQKERTPGHRARRWVVEASHSWLNRFRKILVRYEKTDVAYLGLLHLACSVIAWRKVGIIYG